MIILGISCHYHDSAAVLVKDGTVIAASMEERFSRIKHDSAFPVRAVKFCLEKGRLKSTDLDYVVFYEKPFLKFERIYQSILNYAPRSYGLFREATFATFGEKLWIRSIIENKLNIDSKKILFVPHHLSHAASAFLTSPFEEAAVLTLDGVGEWSTASIGTGNDRRITIDREMRFPASLGLLYSVFTAFLGFEVNSGEYKVMGMAGYGKPIYKDKIYKTFKLFPDGSILPDLSYFSYHYHNRKAFNGKFMKLFGFPRIPKSPFDFRSDGDQYYADIAASIQCVTEEIVLKMAQYVRKSTGMKNLCLAGGVALNGLANFRLAKEKVFENIHIQPAAGDAGGAMGAALYVDFIFGKKKRSALTDVYLGSDYSNHQIKKFLNSINCHSERIRLLAEKSRNPDLIGIPPLIHYREFGRDDDLYNYIAEEISCGKIIGWFEGGAEWGPRALGHRSILADPGNPKMKTLLNEKIKFREPFRPFAPSVLAEHASEFFDLDMLSSRPKWRDLPNIDTENNGIPRLPASWRVARNDMSPLNFMLYVVKVKLSKRKIIPAVTHVDGTSRPQLVKKEVSPRYWGLINAFYKKTGIPMLLNTSFNLSTEPIVNSPSDAYKTYLESGLDILVLGNYIISKDAQKI